MPGETKRREADVMSGDWAAFERAVDVVPPKICLEKLGAKHATFGEAWKKSWRAPLFRHRRLPPTSGGIVTARSEATKQPGGSVTRPLGCFAALGPSIRKSGRPVSSKGTGWRTTPNSQ